MKLSAAESKSQRIARVLEAEIRSGTLTDGAALSSENALVERFAVSRTTVRKGLGILAAKGLIRTKVGIGSFVTYGGAVIDSGSGWRMAAPGSAPASCASRDFPWTSVTPPRKARCSPWTASAFARRPDRA
ncbi:GntR family transcriptional regulator [Salipiger thiooxidans]|uniref:GntR family transcriptional regulator n=1 Tax=Salipiger thiooxidans TaxID=282683 RepID=UPI001F5CB888|nr:GntR family transcriptional regulator [Salipiger thiooxidans]